VREGDLVTAASGAERESLVCFLGARGELPRDEVDRLAGKIPPYGRHAGAALVAHGWLGQDQLWNVLRAHAEWICAAILRLPAGTAQLEANPPGRLRSEPSVFGASTGCELFVELVRRAVSPDEALERLGGESGRIGDGPNQGVAATESNLKSWATKYNPEFSIALDPSFAKMGDMFDAAAVPLNVNIDCRSMEILSSGVGMPPSIEDDLRAVPEVDAV
jgi:hypothetical protein